MSERDTTDRQESDDQRSDDQRSDDPAAEAGDQDGPKPGSLDAYGDNDVDGQQYVDRSKIDFDPADGLLSGTAIDGTSDIPDVEDAQREASAEPAGDDTEPTADGAGTDTDRTDRNAATEEH